MTAKDELRRKFSEDPGRYYTVRLFEEKGFSRRACSKCGRHFWALDGRAACPDHSDDVYSFIGDPPTSKRLDYTAAWQEVRGFFSSNGHAPVGRYPVVCRWRDDLYFTVASIVDFQRVAGSKVSFEFPANPLIIPQTCLRFKDMENVGSTGRHFSSFCMIGQHSVPDLGGYWKDECIDLDYRMLTGPLGIRPEEVVFVEDVWEGGGSFGSSLEYFVRGLELGNAVFTEFQGSPERHTTLDQRIIDMGAGLERFAWITSGTPTAYDCSFGPVIEEIAQKAGCDRHDPRLAAYYTAIARGMDELGLADARRQAIAAAGLSDDQARRVVSPLEDAYLVADHVRTLVFAIADGALPSNVGGGYNLRMLLRRLISAAGRIGLGTDMGWIVDGHIDYLQKTYPELAGARDDVKRIMGIEAGRYAQSRGRMEKIAKSIKSAPSPEQLVKMYESDGITPDYLVEAGAIKEVPPEFYSRLSELHQSAKQPKPKAPMPLEGLPDTVQLYYTGEALCAEFDAKVLCASGSHVVLDRTNFYARGGGQEPDCGTIGGLAVTDVSKHGSVIVHTVDGSLHKEGGSVKCTVDMARRADISAHHTCTHILNASARRVLGSWVWQHSAFKEGDRARLDITHHSALTPEDTARIEQEANAAIRDDMPVTIQELERGAAEQEYGFRIYQGGVVPVKAVRIVSVGDMDVEACGGTHISRTGQAGLMKITRTDRVQDGVVRIEFVAGRHALKHVQAQDADIGRIARMLGADRQKLAESVAKSQSDAESARLQLRHLARRTREQTASAAAGSAKAAGSALFYGTVDQEMDPDYHIAVGQRAAELEPRLVYCALCQSGSGIKAIVYCGAAAQKAVGAGDVAKEVSRMLGGSGGGTVSFAQGGGKDASAAAGALGRAMEMASGA